MIAIEVKPVKVRRGLYELRGVTHTAPDHRGGEICGGQVFAEWFKGPWDADFKNGKETPYKIADSWECYCEKCGLCDSDGWPTLKDCVKVSPEFWCR